MRRESIHKPSADAEANVADGFAAETLFEFPHDFGLGDLFELVVQRRGVASVSALTRPDRAADVFQKRVFACVFSSLCTVAHAR